MNIKERLKLEEDQHEKALKTIGMLSKDIDYIFQELESFIKRNEGSQGLLISKGLKTFLNKLHKKTERRN